MAFASVAYDWTTLEFDSIAFKPLIYERCAFLRVMWPHQILENNEKQKWLLKSKTRCSRRRQISPPVPPLGEVGEKNIRIVCDSDLFGSLYKNMTPSIKPIVHIWLHSCTSVRVAPSHGNVYKKFVKFGRVFQDMRADRQTDKQTKIQTRRSH